MVDQSLASLHQNGPLVVDLNLHLGFFSSTCSFDLVLLFFFCVDLLTMTWT